MKPIGFYPAALSEFTEAAQYYNGKQQGLGIRFIDAVEAAFVRIRNNPQLFTSVDGEIRKCRVRRFPYGILFREQPNDIQIIAVMHLHREPKYWSTRA